MKSTSATRTGPTSPSMFAQAPTECAAWAASSCRPDLEVSGVRLIVRQHFNFGIQDVRGPLDLTIQGDAKHDASRPAIGKPEALIELDHIARLRRAAVADRSVDSFRRRHREQFCFLHRTS